MLLTSERASFIVNPPHLPSTDCQYALPSLFHMKMCERISLAIRTGRVAAAYTPLPRARQTLYLSSLAAGTSCLCAGPSSLLDNNKLHQRGEVRGFFPLLPSEQFFICSCPGEFVSWFYTNTCFVAIVFIT